MHRTPPLLLLLVLCACQRGPDVSRAEVDLRHTRAPGGTPVARWQGDSVTAEELERRLREMSPALRERYRTPEARREYVASLARFELLVREALAQGLHRSPEVVEGTKRALVSRLTRERFEAAPVTVSEAEVADAYARGRADFVRPATVRLSHVFLAAPRGDAARVAAARPRAEELRARAASLAPQDFAAFGALAREHSQEPRTQPLDGDLRLLSDEALAQGYGPEVAHAARALAEPGALSPVVQTEAGLHLLKLRARQPALHVGLEEARPHLVARLTEHKRHQAWADLLAGLERRLDLTVDDAALARVQVGPEAPMEPPQGPPPGTVPAPTVEASRP